MMDIPYNEIIELYRQKDNNPEGLLLRWINKRIRKREIKKIINILVKSLNKRNKIYKEDLCAFFIFLEQLQSVIGAELIEFSSGRNSLYLNRPDNINYDLMFKFSYINVIGQLIDCEVHLTTQDTVSVQNDYFLYSVKSITDGDVMHTNQREVPILEYGDYDSKLTIYTKYIYEMMINTITKYLYRLID